jgi:hypothetical protein
MVLRILTTNQVRMLDIILSIAPEQPIVMVYEFPLPKNPQVYNLPHL